MHSSSTAASPRSCAGEETDVSDATQELDSEAVPQDVLERWRSEGFDKDYSVVEGGAIDCGCDETHPAGEYDVVHEWRHEGMTDPGDEEVLIAATSPCGCKGVLTLAYGPAASADEADVARALAAS